MSVCLCVCVSEARWKMRHSGSLFFEGSRETGWLTFVDILGTLCWCVKLFLILLILFFKGDPFGGLRRNQMETHTASERCCVLRGSPNG